MIAGTIVYAYLLPAIWTGFTVECRRNINTLLAGLTVALPYSVVAAPAFEVEPQDFSQRVKRCIVAIVFSLEDFVCSEICTFRPLPCTCKVADKPIFIALIASKAWFFLSFSKPFAAAMRAVHDPLLRGSNAG